MIVDRAQAHTLEAFIAALLLVAAIIFATQATAVTPLSASTSNQHIENQQRAVASDLLRASAEEGTLTEAVVYWNATDDPAVDGIPRFGNTGDENRSYYTDVPDHDRFGALLDQSFSQTQIAYNIDVTYLTEDDERETIPMVVMGTPSDNAVVATKTVPLFEDTELSYPDGEEGLTLGEIDDDEENDDKTFYAPNVGDGALYNVVEVRITVWRM